MAFNWTKNATASVAGTPTYNKCIFAGGSINLFVLVQSRSGADLKRVLTSPDGITWTLRSTPEALSWVGVAFNGTTLVAVSSTTSGVTQVMTSTDGITWTGRTASEANAWQDVTWIGGTVNLFVAVSQGGTHRVMTSPDGITWTNQTSPATLKTWGGITNDGTTLVASAGTNSTQSIMTSPDGVTWTLQTTPISLGFQNRSIIYAPALGMFLAVSQTGTGHVIRSTNSGVTWVDWGTPPPAWTLTTSKMAAWSPELSKFVLVHSTSDATVALSVDGNVWTTELMDNGVDDFARPWNGIGYSPSLSKFVIFESSTDAVAVASGAAAAPSVDAISPNSGTIRGGTAVSIDGHGFVAGTRVFFGSKEALNVAINSLTNITCTTPKSFTTGSVNVSVRGPNV